jgi:hypothetical protein
MLRLLRSVQPRQPSNTCSSGTHTLRPDVRPNDANMKSNVHDYQHSVHWLHAAMAAAGSWSCCQRMPAQTCWHQETMLWHQNSICGTGTHRRFPRNHAAAAVAAASAMPVAAACCAAWNQQNNSLSVAVSDAAGLCTQLSGQHAGLAALLLGATAAAVMLRQDGVHVRGGFHAFTSHRVGRTWSCCSRCRLRTKCSPGSGRVRMPAAWNSGSVPIAEPSTSTDRSRSTPCTSTTGCCSALTSAMRGSSGGYRADAGRPG